MKQTLLIWGSTLAERRGSGNLWGLSALVALLLLGLPLGMMTLVSWRDDSFRLGATLMVGGIALCGALFLLAFVAFMSVLLNVLRQNHPSHARLVPGHRNGLRRALVRGGAVAVVVSGLLPAVMLMLALHQGVSINPMTAPLFITGLVLWFLLLAPMTRWPQLTLLWIAGPMLLAQMAPQWPGGIAALVQAYQQGGAGLWWATTLATWGLTVLVLRTVVLGGGPGHRRIHARVPRLSNGLATQMTADAAWAQWGLTNTGLLDFLSGRGLFRQRLQASLASSPTRRPALALALPPELQPLGMLATRLPGLLLLSGAVALVSMANPASPWRQMLTPALLGATAANSLAALYYLRMRQQLLGGRGEQALLTLLPGAPQGAALNHWWARKLAATAIVLVSLHGLVCLGGLSLLGEAQGHWWTASLSALLLSLCALPSLWQDWSRAEPATRLAPARPGLMLWAVLAALALNLAVQFLWPTALPWLWLLQALGAAAWALWCWRRMTRWPAAWPVGHAQR